MNRARASALLLLGMAAAAPLKAQDATPGPVALPIDERQAVIGVLDKRTGKTESFTLKPGEPFRFGRITGILRTCETAKPYEPQQSAAYVQVEEQRQALGGRPQPPPQRLFSGWLFAEAPGRNPLQHPVYDVWLKRCTMYLPEGPAPASSAEGTASGGATNPGAARSGGSSNPAASSDEATAAASPG